MKKKILIIVLSILTIFTLTGCEFIINNQTNTTKDGQTAIDRNSIVNDIYSRVYSQIESELKEEIYNKLLEEYGDGTITWETLQEQVYNVIDGAGQANISVTNYQKNTNNEVVAHSYGSGVIYEKEELTDAEYKYRYYAITNQHVVKDGIKFTVGFSDDTSIDAVVVGEDETTDIAVVSFDTSREFTVAEFGDSDSVRVGSFVIAVGNPKGETLFGTATFGIVSGNNRNLIDGQTVNVFLFYIQHDAAINSGNSGGALFTLDSKVVGINSVKYATSEIEGLNFAIPINLVKEVSYQLRTYGSYDGTVSFGITCISVDALTNAGREEYNIPEGLESGILITEVGEGSSSDGLLMANDIIIKVNGTSATKTEDLLPYLRNSKIGDSVVVTVLRDGQEMDITVTFKRKAK